MWLRMIRLQALVSSLLSIRLAPAARGNFGPLLVVPPESQLTFFVRVFAARFGYIVVKGCQEEQRP